MNNNHQITSLKSWRDFLTFLREHAMATFQNRRKGRTERQEAKAVILEAGRLLRHGSEREIRKFAKLISSRELERYMAELIPPEVLARRYRERPRCRRILLQLARDRGCRLRDLWKDRHNLGDGLRCQLAKMIAESSSSISHLNL